MTIQKAKNTIFFLIGSLLPFMCSFADAVQLSNKKTKLEELKPIKILSWWDYVAPQVIDDFAKKKVLLEFQTYKSNESALSQLTHNTSNFEVGIFSNVVLKILSSKGSTRILPLAKSTPSETPYASWIKNNSYQCAPFLWSATVFVYNSTQTPFGPKKLQDFSKFRSKGFRVGVIDDVFEFAERYRRDHSKQLYDAKQEEFESLGFHPKEFVTSIEEFLKIEKSVAYGWHGVVALRMKEKPSLEFAIPEKGTVIGYDVVCMLNPKKGKLSASRKEYLKKFILELTNKKNTEIHMEQTQYFSPFENHTVGLLPKVAKLKTEIETELNLRSATSVDFGTESITPEIMKKITPKWRKIRYEK